MFTPEDELDVIDALARVEAELSRLRDERDAEIERATENGRLAQTHYDRAVAAEARCARLQQALEAGANYLRKLSDPVCLSAIRQVALDHFAELNGEALAGPDTPAADELQRRADEIYAADKAQDYNHMRGDS